MARCVPLITCCDTTSSSGLVLLCIRQIDHVQLHHVSVCPVFKVSSSRRPLSVLGLGGRRHGPIRLIGCRTLYLGANWIRLVTPLSDTTCDGANGSELKGHYSVGSDAPSSAIRPPANALL